MTEGSTASGPHNQITIANTGTNANPTLQTQKRRWEISMTMMQRDPHGASRLGYLVSDVGAVVKSDADVYPLTMSNVECTF